MIAKSFKNLNKLNNMNRIMKFCSNQKNDIDHQDTMVYSSKVKNITLQQDLEPLRKQIIWRANNLGMKELDLVIGTWAKQNVMNLSAEELEQFHKEILEQETPDLFRQLMGYVEIPETSVYLKQLKHYAMYDENKDLLSNL